MTYILALDQGTSSSRALIYDAAGAVVGSAQHSIDSSYPQDGWVEQDPEAIWGTIVQAGREAIAAAGIDPSEIAGIGITNQRETSLLWDRDTSQCPYSAIVWQDRRSAPRCEALAQQRYPQDQADGQLVSELIEHTTGLIIDPYFSSTKVEWLLDRVDSERSRAAKGELCFGTVDSFLVWRLTKGARHVTDATNASRTQLLISTSRLGVPRYWTCSTYLQQCCQRCWTAWQISAPQTRSGLAPPYPFVASRGTSRRR